MLDVSISMDGKKLADAIDGAIGFAKDALDKAYAVGVIRFSDKSEVVCKASRDIASLASAVRGLQIDSGTQITPALLLAREYLISSSLKRAVVLFTDGESQDQSEALRTAAGLKNDGIEIIAIGTDDANSKFLRQIASRTDLVIEATTRLTLGTTAKPGIADAIRRSAALLSS